VPPAPLATPPGWDELTARIRSCTACPELAANRQSVVVGAAPAGARLLLVGEAPGAAEDETGLPFVGKAGAVLDATLEAAGLDRTQVAVANVLKCRPPRNRRPEPDEIGRCRGWLEAQLALVDPLLVVPLGLTATAWFLGPRLVLRDVRGRVHTAGGRSVLPTYHPSGALRFGPRGEPMRLLREDLAAAARIVASG